MTELAKNLIDKLNLNGLYWDEPQYSAWMYDYGKQWDGASGVIDRDSHALERTRSLVPLLSARFRYSLMDWLEKNHYTLVCNSEPMTPEDGRYKIHRFIEEKYWNLQDAQLFSPVALADPAARNGNDTIRQQREYLDQGVLYDYYNEWIKMDNPGLCRWMYPITPVALGPGYILGREKILTNRSGRYSWGDKILPPVDVHVIDATGREVKADWEKVTADGKEWVRLTLPPDCAAAIVRR